MDLALGLSVLPSELIIEICIVLPAPDILSLASACRTLRSVWLHNANAIYQVSECQTECRALLSQQDHPANILEAGDVYRLLRNVRKAVTSALRFEDEIAHHIKGKRLLVDM